MLQVKEELRRLTSWNINLLIVVYSIAQHFSLILKGNKSSNLITFFSNVAQLSTVHEQTFNCKNTIYFVVLCSSVYQ